MVFVLQVIQMCRVAARLLSFELDCIPPFFPDVSLKPNSAFSVTSTSPFRRGDHFIRRILSDNIVSRNSLQSAVFTPRLGDLLLKGGRGAHFQLGVLLPKRTC